jgi:hypothetical protein
MEAEYGSGIPAFSFPFLICILFYIFIFKYKHTLLSNLDFRSNFDYAPFQECTTDGTHHFQDFMSGNWAWTQAVSHCHHLFDLTLILVMKDIIAEDPKTHGSIFCPIILSSDKTTVSVATGHNEYWPIYFSIGNIHNNI